ncbi:MAG: M23 family metallopeptidase, partial [Chloroflexi bacterium]|nr:M23 family metallopeptidase [Chloroflexota bacterium]
MLGRALAKAALATSLVLSLLPPVAARVDAAPPEPVREATTASSEDVAADSEADPGSAPPLPQDMSAPLPGTENQLGEDSTPLSRTSSDFSSVRPRGLEAPVELKQEDGQGADHEQVEQPEIANADIPKADTPKDEKRDPGDGPVRKRDVVSQERDRAQQGIRVWPMPAASYTFTQQFGCVPQLGNLYFPGEGCPAETPVIHTGIDLAAPEGTLFYAAASGWVTLADYDRPTSDANTRIIIQHDGRNERYATDYRHWIASYVDEGDYVQAGDPIGEVGSVGFSKGPHLHYSVTELDTGHHIDPLRWIPEESGFEGYVSRRPAAHLRLPPGTNPRQPEYADPAP